MSDLTLGERLAALEREADNRDEMEAMIAQRYCEHIKLLDTKVERLVAELERERMCHVACGVIAMSNTRKSLAENRKMHPDYLSASVQDCIKAAEREIELREQVERLFADKERLDWILPRISGAEWRRIGVNYRGNCNREAIDAAMAPADKTKKETQEP